MGFRRRTLDRGPHCVLVVLDHIDDRQVPKPSHIEALVDLALVGRPVAEVGERHLLVVAVVVGQRQPGAQRDLRADDPVPAIEVGLGREHVHRPTLAFGRAAGPAGQFGHDLARIHAAGEHVAMIAVAGDDLVARLLDRLHADRDRFLADVKVAEAADQAHAVELAGPLLEAPDQQHVAIVFEQLVLGHAACGAAVGVIALSLSCGAGLPTRHLSLP
jgi:hypothetical protein